MKLTIDQVLKKGIEEHKAGKLQEAERLYRAILKSQPTHPDANHNLGVIAFGLNKNGAALPLFKTALEASPNIEQFWLSYINALIQEEYLDNAKQFIQKAKQNGIVGERLGALEAQLSAVIQKVNPGLKAPTRQQLSSLLELYQSGRYADAEALALCITKQFPKQQFGWKVLGAVLRKTGRLRAALVANRKTLQLDTRDPAAYNNLGNVLRDLGQLEEAETSLRKAIAYKSDYAEAYNNLGVTLKDLGRLEEAETILRRGIACKSDYAEVYNNLAFTLKDLGRLEEALELFKKSTVLNSNFASDYNNCGVLMLELNRLKDSEINLRRSIKLKADSAEAICNLARTLDFANNLEEASFLLEDACKIDSDGHGLKAAVRLAILKFLADDFVTSRELLLGASRIQEKLSTDFRPEKVYQRYLLRSLEYYKDKILGDWKQNHDKILHVIGESHALASHRLSIKTADGDFLCKSLLITGCKQWDLGSHKNNKYKIKLENILSCLPQQSQVLLAVGEIDCRLDYGLIKHRRKFPEKNMLELISVLIENYLNYICKITAIHGHKIFIQGVPCPNIETKTISHETLTELIEVIKLFNFILKRKSDEKGFRFLDVYSLTDRGDGFSNGEWHIDDYHLSQKGMQAAWLRMC